MRNEKGIDFLLRALRQYRGPPFTLLLAGPPVDVSEEVLEQIDRNSPVKIIYELEFIDYPELYFRAADAVVLPYKWEYGKERASQLFEEVCGSGRPVIVPDFGVLGRLTKEWNLGTTYNQGSARSLSTALTMFASEGIPFSEDRIREYSKQQTYQRTAIKLSSIYEQSSQVPSSRYSN